MNPATNWTPGVVVLLVALAIGVAVVLWSRRGAFLPAPERTRRDELLRQKEALYALIREHKAAEAQGPEWAAERDRLELEAARVLRDLDALGDPAAAPATSASQGFGVRNPKLVGALYGAGAMLFLGALGLALNEFTAPRPEGGSMTGNTAGEGGAGEPALTAAQQAFLAELSAKVEAAPDDIDARNQLGHALLQAGKLMDSYKQAEAVVALRPDDPEARTHQAIVLIAIGDSATAGKALDRVLADAPGLGEALAYRGALHFQAGELEQAVALLEKAAVADPELERSVRPLIEAAKSGKGPMMASGGASAAPGPGATADAAPSASDVTGTIAVDAAAADKVKPGDTLFLSARAPGVDRGPPTWVRRIPVESLPMAFTLGPANAMIAGIPVPAEVVITARIDRDGDAKTRGPEDLEGRTPAIAPGTKDVTITLATAAP